MNNKWEKDCYYWVLAYMLVQTIQSEFDEGTEDIIKTLKKLLDFPIQPLKRSYMQECFNCEKVEPQASPVSSKKMPNPNWITRYEFYLQNFTKKKWLLTSQKLNFTQFQREFVTS